MNTRLIRPLAVLFVIGLAASACGSSSKKSSGSSNGSSTTAASSSNIMDVVKSDPLIGTKGTGLTRGVTADSIKLGCIADTKSYVGFEDGMKARFARANAAGGINGRKIDFKGCENDGADQQQFLSLTKQLVQQDQVFGVATIEGVIPQAAFDFMGQQQVPYTGWGFLPGFCGARWGFGWNGCLVGNALKDNVPHAVEQANLADAIIAASGLKPADVKAAIQGEDTESSKVAQQQYTDVFKHAGATMAYTATNVPVPGPVSDYTPFVRPLVDAKPNIVQVATSFNNVGGYTAALKAAGYTGVIMNYVAYVPGLLGAAPQLAAAIEGSYINTQIVPQEQQTPWVKQMETDLTAEKAATGKFITFGGALGYAEANTWVGMLTAAGKTLDTKTFDQAMNTTGTKITPGADGGIGDTTWPQMHFLPTDCGAIVKVVNKAFTVALPFKCYESIRVR